MHVAMYVLVDVALHRQRLAVLMGKGRNSFCVIWYLIEIASLYMLELSC